MNDLTAFILYFKKIITTFKIILAKPVLGIKSAIPAVGAPVAAAQALPYFSLFQWSLISLAILFILDFATGIWASFEEYKKAKEVTPASAAYLIQSSKLRLSLVKAITYSFIILLSWGIGFLFIIEEFSLTSAMRKFTLPTIVTLICCTIEAYSIFFENIKRAGFDLVGKIKTIVSTGYKLKEIIKNNDEKA